MEDIQNIKKQADEYRKAKNYTEALPLYKNLWDNYRDSCNEWDGWGYAFCLRHLKEYQSSLDICREVYKIKPDFEQIKGLYAWCIYYTEIAVTNVTNESNFFKAGEGILRLIKENDQYSPFLATVFKTLEYLNEKAIYPTDKILEWTSKLNFEALDSTPYSFTDNDGKVRELASKKEQYFMWRTKALQKKGLFDECIELSQKALETLETFHYSNDVWFARRISLSYRGLGKLDIALKQLEDLLKHKNEWFIYKEIAEIYLEQKDIDNALKFAVNGALCFGDIDKKLNLYKLLVDILTYKNQDNDAKKHVELIYQIRKSQDWDIDNELQILINKFQVDTNQVLNTKNLEKDLKQLWEKLKFSGQEIQVGTIKSILPNGKAGFIETENRKSYYFKITKSLSSQRWCKEGQKVSFFLEKGFDTSKNRETENAVNLRQAR